MRDVRGVVDAEADDEDEVGGRDDVDLHVPPRDDPHDVDHGEDDAEEDHEAEAQVAQHQQRDHEHRRQRQGDVASQLVACWNREISVNLQEGAATWVRGLVNVF